MVIVGLTNGFGNNLFQYIAAKQLADFHEQELFVVAPPNYYAKSDLESIGIEFRSPPRRQPGQQAAIQVNDSNYQDFFSEKITDRNFSVSGYFEDYNFYVDNLSEIKSWFPTVRKRNDKDLVIHFRTGDRLFYKNEFDYKPTCEQYLKAVKKFKFDNLHIVTDMPVWKYIDRGELEQMSFHVNVPPHQRVDLSRSVDYFNSLVHGFSKLNPIVENRSIIEDFNFIRTFDNILFEHGTMGWWAAALSSASKIGVYGPWRPWKGESNKNLSQVGLKGWFQWK